MNNNKTMKVCPNGHYYEGEECPYCPPVYDKKTKLYPTFAMTENVPSCPHCGRPIRKIENIDIDRQIGSIGNCRDGRVPWNYKWNGKCDNCGHDFNINITQNISGFDLRDKQTSVKIANRTYPYSRTDSLGIYLSGVEIETYAGMSGCRQKQEIFLSTNELKYLLKVLGKSPILKQEDCEFDTDSFTLGRTIF